MQSRSRMAAWSLALGVGLVMLWGGGHSTLAAAPPVKNRVKLEIEIAGLGLGPGECELEIKPGHAGCRFPAVVKRVERTKTARGVDAKVVVDDLDPILAESTNADRDCAFAITVREPGQPPRTFRRGLRLMPQTPAQPIPVQSMTCYISSPSLLARDEESRARR